MRNTLSLLATVFVLVTVMPASAATEVATLDDGNLYLFVSNNGTFAFDSSASRGEYSGLYYPKDTYKWLMSGGGIWVAGKKNDQWRVTISGSESEFVSGPAYHRINTPSPFPVYKITRGENYALNDDYRNWPEVVGAPTNAFGQPLVMGSQCLFTLFTDTDTAAHGSSIAGTLPLGVEVKLYAYTYDDVYQTFDTTMTQVVFFDYTIINRSVEAIDSCIVTIYGDPDIGYSYSDRVGSDSADAAVYCYDEANYDAYAGSRPPAVGMCLLDGQAASANFYHVYRTNDPPSLKLDSLYKTINLIKGLGLTGQPYFDSTTMATTKFPYGGNPVDSTGWINKVSRDYRFVLNTAPVLLRAGDSVKVTAALVVAQGESNLGSVSRLRETIRTLRQLCASDTAGLQLRLSPGDAVTIRGASVRGRDWGGRYLSGGLDLASRYFGDSLVAGTVKSACLTVNEHAVQNAYKYIREGNHYRYTGMSRDPVEVTMPGLGDRIDYGYIDSDGDGTIQDQSGKLEPIVVFQTNYGETPKEELTQLDLSTANAIKAFVVQLDATVTELAGSKLTINGNALSSPWSLCDANVCDATTISEPSGDSYSERALTITNGTSFAQEINLVSSDPIHLRVTPALFELGTGETKRLFAHCFPSDSGGLTARLELRDYGIRGERRTLDVSYAVDSTMVSGDANEDSLFTLSDLITMVRILYRGAPMSMPRSHLDANCDGLFNLVDLVIYLDVLYQQAQLPCSNPNRP